MNRLPQRVVAIIQARTGSTRLPSKIFLDVAGKPMLARVIERVRRARRIDMPVVATTTLKRDDAVADFCRELGVTCTRGSEVDLLDRYVMSAREVGADVVVRITSDCPLIDAGVSDEVVGLLLDGEARVDYASNFLDRRTFPRGLDTEAVSQSALERAWREDDNTAWREHATPYIYRNPAKFRLASVHADTDRSALRWTVDTAKDLELVRRIYTHFGDTIFGWRDVLALVDAVPELTSLNRDVAQKAF